MRGHPEDCVFLVGEGSDYKPIRQSYEIRELRRQNIKLKEQLRDSRPWYLGNNEYDGGGCRSSRRIKQSRQKCFHLALRQRCESVTQGTISMAEVSHTQDLDHVQ